MNRRGFIAALGAWGALGWSVSAWGMRPLGDTVAELYNRPVRFTDDDLPDVPPALFDIDPAATAQQQLSRYPQSVASGDPRANGIVLWTRVALPEPSSSPDTNMVGWQIARDAAFDTVVMEGAATLTADRDRTVKLPIAHAALAPFTTYYYRFVHGGVASRVGRFKTLPDEDADITHLRLGYVTCQDYGNGYYTALAHLADEALDYVVHLGDYIYETIDAGFQNDAARALPPFASGGTIPQNVDDYRHLYKTYRSDNNLQRLHERFAMIAIWDDHEFGNDAYGDVHPDNKPGQATTTPEPALRQAANQAWSEYMPADTPFNADAPWDQSLQIYRSFRFGQLVDLVATDERLYRDGPPCGNSEAFERYASLGCRERLSADRTMLGQQQKTWFVDRVTRSQARWKLWANEVMLMQLKAGAVFVNLDQWDGYPAERADILTQIQDTGTTNLVALTGDLHTFCAGHLKPDFDRVFGPSVGVELMVGSITSANVEDSFRSAIDKPSRPMPVRGLGYRDYPALGAAIQLANPHIEYWNSSVHGYAVLDITPAALTCRYMAVETIREPTSAIHELKRFQVMDGEPRLIDVTPRHWNRQ